MKNFTTSKTKAIKLGKHILKSENNVNRLAYSIVKSTSCKCCCGETEAYNVTAEIKKEFYDITIGVCKQCNNN